MAFVERQWRHVKTGIFTNAPEIPSRFDWEEVSFDPIKGKYSILTPAELDPEDDKDEEAIDPAVELDASQFEDHPPTKPVEVNRIPAFAENRVKEYTPPSKIKGYRQLSALEVELTNAVKEHAEATKHLITSLENASVSDDYPEFALDGRWLSIAKTDLQKGYMFLVRSITKPTTF